MPLTEDAQRDQSAERFLRLVQERRRGRLKIYLGLAAGVGKTYRMLQEAHDLLARINSNDKAAREIIRKTSRLADRFGAAAWYVLYVQTRGPGKKRHPACLRRDEREKCLGAPLAPRHYQRPDSRRGRQQPGFRHLSR